MKKGDNIQSMTRHHLFHGLPSGLLVICLTPLSVFPAVAQVNAAQDTCTVRTATELVTLESPHFRFVLNVTKGLRPSRGKTASRDARYDLATGRRLNWK